MKINEYLSRSIASLTAAGVPTTRLDCLVLLEDVLNTNRTQILAHPENEITEVQQKLLDSMVAKRAQHIPLAYIRGKTEFYGREYAINNHVLEPRPESETMIELLKRHTMNMSTNIIDVGTGSGALAITAALELKTSAVAACDIDSKCIKMAKINAAKHEVDISFYEGDLLTALPGSYRIKPARFLCNLPYVPNDFHINTAASHEPPHAIFGGDDGLDLYRKLFNQLSVNHPGNTYVFCESLPTQHQQLSMIADAAKFTQLDEQDFIQVFTRS